MIDLGYLQPAAGDKKWRMRLPWPRSQHLSFVSTPKEPPRRIRHLSAGVRDRTALSRLRLLDGEKRARERDSRAPFVNWEDGLNPPRPRPLPSRPSWCGV